MIDELREFTSKSPLHSLLFNLSVDLMLRASNLLQLKVSDVMTESGKSKEIVQLKQGSTEVLYGIALSPYSIRAIENHLAHREPDEFIFQGQKSGQTGKPISVQQFSRIIKNWIIALGLNPSDYSSESFRKAKVKTTIIRLPNNDVE